MNFESMNWIRGRRRSWFDYSTLRIVARPRRWANQNSPELCPLFSVNVGHMLLAATAIRRKRGPSLSRRIGQTGNVFQHAREWSPTAPTYGRYWIDVPGAKRKRRTVT